MIKRLQEQGFLILEDSIGFETRTKLSQELSKLNTSITLNNSEQRVYGVRNLINISPAVKAFSFTKDVRRIVESILGSDAKVVRAIYFDKTPEANWKVPWHQYLTISVKEKIVTKGFSAWSLKSGINRVQPPIEILKRMLTLRFHLDDADETNGALRVLPKTQTFGRLGATEI